MSEDQVQEIKDRVDIVELVNQYVPLKKSGANHKGLCPFHKEKSPSFMVNPERQIFKCFGCDEGGDVLSFVQKVEGLTFPEALELLADRVGVKLDRRKAPEQYQREKDEKTTLFRINAAAAKFFHHLLINHKSGKEALEYLESRTVTRKTIDEFQLGFAPPKSVLGAWLGKHGFSATELRKAGSPERFRNRIMFPLRDTLGNVVGFTGRLLPESQASEPKYYNTPETPIFKKSKIVYGLPEGKKEIRQRDTAVLVEGQMDVILSHQAGARIAVASSGTAITLDHLKAIRRYTSNILIAFDADAAGATAAKKTIGLTFDAELSPKIVPMPDGYKDAGEVIEQDTTLWGKTIGSAVPAVDWLIDHEVRSAGKSLDGAKKKVIAKQVLPLLQRVQDPVEQAHYLGQLAVRLHVPEQSLIDALKKTKRRRRTSPPPQSDPNKQSNKLLLDEQLAFILAKKPSALETLTVSAELFTPQTFAERLFKATKTWYDSGDRQRAANSFDAIHSSLSPDDQQQFDAQVLAVQELIGDHDPAEIAQELSTRLRRDSHESLKASIAERIRQAESTGDRQAVKQLMKELQGALKN